MEGSELNKTRARLLFSGMSEFEAGKWGWRENGRKGVKDVTQSLGEFSEPKQAFWFNSLGCSMNMNFNSK